MKWFKLNEKNYVAHELFKATIQPLIIIFMHQVKNLEVKDYEAL